MKPLLTSLAFVSLLLSAGAAVFVTNSPDADAFVRSNAPASNYGAAGALSVSGPTATNSAGVANGVFDSFMRFNTAAMVTNFNFAFGTNNWVITSATLQVTEDGGLTGPANAIFNRGKGAFEIRWIANDNWSEGTGTPNAPTTDGIAYSNEASLLNANTDTNLGIFTNTGTANVLNLSLGLPSAFVTNLEAGGEVGLYLTAIDPGIGFTFNSRNFTTASARPVLVVSALAQPGLTSLSVAANNLVLSATNGVALGTYFVLTTTNLLSPASQWTPIQTNILSAGGSFALTLTNAVNSNAQQFFILRTQ